MTTGLRPPRRRRARGTWIAGLVLLALLAVPLPVARGADSDGITFGRPTADGALLEPLRFGVDITSAVAPVRVDLLTRLEGEDVSFVREAPLHPDGEGRFQASLTDTAPVQPNTTLVYRFRALLPDGSVTESEEETLTVADERFEWRSRSDGVVTLHWYEGDDAFADRALAIGSAAITKAATLLGVEEVRPVDFFVYADQDAFYDALGPGTRENVGGQANSDIRTMFGLITPAEVGSDWVDTLVSHELTHLVFADAVANPYHLPPRWLNEGLAVHLSQGYDVSDRITVQAAAADGSLIPLEGLAGLFPTTRDRFGLAYAESSSAVDHLVRTHGDDALVALITSYADGVTDDEAFRAALGMSLAEFDDAWMASLGASRPVPYGPQPPAPGRIPPGWEASPAP